MVTQGKRRARVCNPLTCPVRDPPRDAFDHDDSGRETTPGTTLHMSVPPLKVRVPTTSIHCFGRDMDGVCRGGVAVGRAPAEIAEELFRFGWQIATLHRDHHQVVGWVRLDPNGSEATWYAEQC